MAGWDGGTLEGRGGAETGAEWETGWVGGGMEGEGGGLGQGWGRVGDAGVRSDA